MSPLQSVFDSEGYKPKHLKKYLERQCFNPDDTDMDTDMDESPSQSLESEESYEEEFEDSDPLLIRYFEVEIVSFILKLWLRRIQLTEQAHGKNQSIENFEHKIHKSQQEVIEPFKAYLLSSKSREPEEVMMLHHYSQSLNDGFCTLCEERDKASFYVPEEDYERFETDEAFVCSLLGLRLDFLDRLRVIPQEDREHRTLCAWIVTFLRDNFECLDLTTVNTKELLYAIGFDPFCSAVETISARAGNMKEHIEACDWAKIFIQGEFKYNPLLSQRSDTFPFFSEKTNECFPWNDDNNRDCHVNIVNLVTKESQSSIDTEKLMRNFQLEDERYTVLYHGTDYESAIDILMGRGIYLWAGRQKRDFSSGFGFYLTNRLDDALNWALSTTRKPAILVFRVDHAIISEAKRLLLSSEDRRWREIVSSFRTNKGLAKTEQMLSTFDVIEGPVAEVHREGRRRGSLNGTNLVFEPKPSSYQMCLLSEDFAEEFEQTLHSIFFYDISS